MRRLLEGTAVVQDDLTCSNTSNEKVPHHPSTAGVINQWKTSKFLDAPRCSVIEKHVFVGEISTYEQLFAGLQKHATSTVDDRPAIVRWSVRNSKI
jgi:hypothetical protein